MPIDYYKLDAFTKSYIACALWTFVETDGNSSDPDHSELAPHTLALLVKDSEDFQKANAELIGESLDHAGHDFWLTRNGHGAGFWDDNWEESRGEKLNQAAKAYQQLDLYRGDDGLIYAL